jgi:alpha-D-ribose 1-methylphosphonate 5-phosphate C-P lyase
MNPSKDENLLMFRASPDFAKGFSVNITSDRYVHACADCGSNRVYIDITLDWNFEHQAWVANNDDFNVSVGTHEAKCADCGSDEIIQLTLPPDWRKQP